MDNNHKPDTVADGDNMKASATYGRDAQRRTNSAASASRGKDGTTARHAHSASAGSVPVGRSSSSAGSRRHASSGSNSTQAATHRHASSGSNSARDAAYLRASGGRGSAQVSPNRAASNARDYATTAVRGASPNRSTASAGRRPQQRVVTRGHAARSSRRNNKTLILLGIGAVAVLLCVLLIVILPGLSKRDSTAEPVISAVSTSAPEQVPATAIPAGYSSTLSPGTVAAPVSDAADASAPETDVPTSSAGRIVLTASADNEKLIEKYGVLDNIPRTQQPLGLPEGARVADSFFDDAIFIGDSVTAKLRAYVLQQRKGDQPDLLGKANFLAATSFGTRNALREISENSIHPVIGGVKMTLEDAIATSGAKKVYIMLGMNDVGVSGIEASVANMGELLQRIRDKNPGIEIYVQSATPRLSGTHPTTNQLFVYDVKLYDALMMLNDPGIHFVDVAYVMRDEEGKLIADYCDDPDGMALHFTNAGCRQWIDYLYTHTAS